MGRAKANVRLLRRVVTAGAGARRAVNNPEAQPNARAELYRARGATRATRRDIRNWRRFGFRDGPEPARRRHSGDSPARPNSGKPQLEGVFSMPDPLTSGSTGPSSAPPAAAPARCHKLGLYSSNQGGGLDFVCGRGYGRQRWPECPVKTNKDRWLLIIDTEESWPFPS
jgi:hypothetical protein